MKGQTTPLLQMRSWAEEPRRCSGKLGFFLSLMDTVAPHHEVCRSTRGCLCREPSSSSAVNCLAPAQETEPPPQDRLGPQLASRASRLPAPSCLLYQQLAPRQPLGRPRLASAMLCCPCRWQGRPCCLHYLEAQQKPHPPQVPCHQHSSGKHRRTACTQP